jgi:hypothetical protein
MSATVISLEGHRRNHPPAARCQCDPSQDWVCYPHRLVDLAARIEDLRGDVEQLQFCDLATFRKFTDDVFGVIESITTDCEPGVRPDERNVR